MRRQTTTALPTRPEDIDRDWLASALGVEVKGVEVVDIMHGASTKLRLRIDADDPSIPPTLILKGGFEPHSSTLGHMYAIEARFYRDVARALPIRCPRSWFAQVDPDGYRSIILMEDLTLAGVNFCHASRPQGFEAVARRLKAMARYHAASWNDRRFAPGGEWADIVSRFDNPAVLGWIDQYTSESVLRRYLDSPRAAALSSRYHDRHWLRSAMLRVGEIEREGAICLIHGDTHLGNCYVESDGTPGFYDMQIARASPFVEVSYHVIGALDLADRARFEKPLLALYLDALAGEGVDAPDFDTAWLAYRRSIVVGLFIFLINDNAFQTEWVNTANTARYAAAAVDHDLARLMP